MSNSQPNNSTGVAISGASGSGTLCNTCGVQLSYTPPTSSAGSNYYYAIVSSNCGTATSSVSGAVIVTKINQTITFNTISGVCPNGTTTLSASASSGLPITFSSSNTAVATINGNTLTGVAGGLSVITANQAGNSNYNAASINLDATVYTQPNVSITSSGSTILCPGGSVTLTATSAVSYQWSTGATSQSINVSTSGSYSVTVTNSNGCSASSSSTQVTVNPNPSVSISGASTACSSTTLTASGGVSYSWSGVVSGSGNSKTVSSTGWVYVTGIDSNGCSNTANYYVTINSIPSVSISGPSSACGSTVLSASGGSSYSWSGPGISGGGSSKTIYSTGWYYVTGYSSAGCSNNASIYVTINSIPSISISGPSSACVSTTLTANGGSVLFLERTRYLRRWVTKDSLLYWLVLCYRL